MGMKRVPLVTRLPRRRRVILIPVLVLLAWALLPGTGFNPLRQLLRGLRGSSDEDVLRYVDPLIGTANGGHVFPGASLPYGMAKAVADCNIRGENAGGFVSDDSLIVGFSHLHDSGRQLPSLGNFPLFVHPGCPEGDYAQCRFSTHDRAVARVNNSVTATPGYFAIGLNNSVYAEMTTTQRAALYRFAFFPPASGGREATAQAHDAYGTSVPSASGGPLVLLDLNDLARSRLTGSVQVNATSGRITASAAFRPSFGTGHYDAHVCVDFDPGDGGAQILNAGTFTDRGATNATLALASEDVRRSPGSAGAWVQFAAASKIAVRVGLSFISAEQACRNGVNEAPDFDFAGTVRAAEAAWRDKLAGAVQVVVDNGGQTAAAANALQTTFWSGLYRAMLAPQDYTGENPLWDSWEPYFDSFYCIWDSFRVQHPLLTIIDPEAQTRMVRSLIDTYKHEGKLPDCRMSFSRGFTQGGSNADVVLADAFVKRLGGGGHGGGGHGGGGYGGGEIDWALAYNAAVSDAELEPADWAVAGRGGLESWHRLGYVPVDDDDALGGRGPRSRSVSRTVEYAYDDFAIALMARGLGHKGDEATYLQRSRNWRNLFNPEQEDRDYDEGEGESEDEAAAAAAARPPLSEFRGFLQPRFRNGSWARAGTRTCSPGHEPHACYLDTRHATYEGSPWLYSFYVPQDMAALIKAMGGRDLFVARLSHFHAADPPLVDMGNEPSFLTALLFHYAGRPGLSARWLRNYVPSRFNASAPGGLPGNDDTGAMGAFAAFAAMGFYPVAGQDVYLLTPPMFREVRLRTPNGGTSSEAAAVIRAVGRLGGGGGAGAWGNSEGQQQKQQEEVYIQRVRLNGEEYTRSWITHDFFLKGGTLEIVLGPRESTWGTAEDDLPPSLSTGLTWAG
ncbi:alpha-1,2-mannosidase-like protein [Xylariaceae sp. FL0804]|nr:alpha-1,2-mannosidase-like protein [Xylariaceae sp. FL0804]